LGIDQPKLESKMLKILNIEAVHVICFCPLPEIRPFPHRVVRKNALGLQVCFSRRNQFLIVHVRSTRFLIVCDSLTNLTKNHVQAKADNIKRFAMAARNAPLPHQPNSSQEFRVHRPPESSPGRYDGLELQAGPASLSSTAYRFAADRMRFQAARRSASVTPFTWLKRATALRT
jgi:hypothetical protein